ncbi:2,3-bisphosphoglycerate-independent phosphoglycerate mutase [Patescibacteria group bacterium]
MTESETKQIQTKQGQPTETAPVIGIMPGVGIPVAAQNNKEEEPKAAAATEGTDGLHLPVVLLVLDGWGVAPESRGNAISLAETPQMDALTAKYPTVTLHASGEMVGLPWEEMGNSEVGHLNIGSGKIIYQNLPLIDKSITEGVFAKNEVFLDAMKTVKEKGSKLHILGLVSDGGIHSSQNHLNALLDMCKKQELNDNVVVHPILDGRDTAKNAALTFIAQLETKMQETGIGKIATLAGRHFSMDRDNRWDRVEAAYNAMRFGKADHTCDSPLKAIEQSYERNIFDEQFPPTVITGDDGQPVATVEDNDVIIFFNFRADRARQLTKAFVLPGFQKFDRGAQVEDLTFICMTEYEKNLPAKVAFTPDTIETPVAKVVSEAGMDQLHIAETEKYAHVTFFFNGGIEEQFDKEERVLIPSPHVKSYDETPAMSVHEVADRLVKELETDKFEFVVANFANADMVGHTGNIKAAVEAVQEADKAVGKVVEAVLAKNGTVVITADHGNAEDMLDLRSGEMIKEHSTNTVPCVLINSELAKKRAQWPPVVDGDLSRLQPVGVLSDVAPTVLTLLGLPVPADMTSRSII